jgi:hypothetical protein
MATPSKISVRQKLGQQGARPGRLAREGLARRPGRIGGQAARHETSGGDQLARDVDADLGQDPAAGRAMRLKIALPRHQIAPASARSRT